MKPAFLFDGRNLPDHEGLLKVGLEVHAMSNLDEARIAAWNSDSLPIYEPRLKELVEKCRGRNRFFSADVQAGIVDADIIFASGGDLARPALALSSWASSWRTRSQGRPRRHGCRSQRRLLQQGQEVLIWLASLPPPPLVLEGTPLRGGPRALPGRWP